MTHVILVRHGQTLLNRQPSFRGRTAIPLDEKGLQQAEATGRRIAATWPVQAVYSSPLRRAMQTAEAIARPLELEAQPYPGLNDMDFGEWQALPVQEVQARWPAELQEWIARPQQLVIPGGETLAACRERVMTALGEIMARHLEEWIVVVGHNVTNRLILLAALGLGNERFWRLGQSTCAINLLRFDGKEFYLDVLNDTCHLGGKGLKVKS